MALALFISGDYDIPYFILTNTLQLCCGDERINVLTRVSNMRIDDRITQCISLCL